MILGDKWLYIPSFEVVLNKYRLIFYYCCPVNFKTAEKSTPKPFSMGLRAFFFKKSKPPEN